MDFTDRITILSTEKIRKLYDPPKFSQEERVLYFSMDYQEQNLALSCRSLIYSYETFGRYMLRTQFLHYPTRLVAH